MGLKARALVVIVVALMFVVPINVAGTADQGAGPVPDAMVPYQLETVSIEQAFGEPGLISGLGLGGSKYMVMGDLPSSMSRAFQGSLS